MPPKAPPADRRIDDAALFRRATSTEALFAAWGRVNANQGAAGGDGVSLERFRPQAALAIPRLSRALVDGRYHPGPIRRVLVPKKSGGSRPLDIPSIVDRIAQTAIAQALGPELEREFEDSSFGYRPGRSVAQAVARVASLRSRGATYVVDADIERFFESVPHDKLMERLQRSLADGPASRLIALWLEHAAPAGRGLAQGSPLSPLLANLYLDALDEEFDAHDARIVRYADDFVILAASEKGAQAARRRAERLLGQHGLALHPDKTRIVSFDEGFRFLGHLFVRSLVMPSHEEGESPIEAALRAVAAADAADERGRLAAETADASARAAGHEPDFRILYLRKPGRRLSIRNQAFTVEEGSGGLADPVAWRELVAVPHQDLDRIELGPAAWGVEAAFRHALATDTPLALTNGHGETLGWLAPALSPRAARHLGQARHVLDPEKKLDLARRFVRGRLVNQRALLRRLNRERKDAATLQALADLNQLIRRAPEPADVDTLRGIEGRGAALFWPAFGRMLDHGFAFRERKRRQGADPANILLDFAASLMTRDAAVAVSRAGLHPGFGYLHETTDGRDSVVLDLAEEFRAPLAESVVVQAVNKRAVAIDMFSKRDGGGWRMEREGAEGLIRAYENAVERVVMSPRTKRRRGWRGIMLEQALLLAAHVEGRAVYQPYALDY